ncbi:MAG: DUF2939 domain-containing protein [Proteobacteria bacterium]|nr:DUF2939 domain-containing protein [Pseudomonadota bacterium]
MTAAALVITATSYAVSPYVAAQSLADAIRTGDRDRLEQLIDFPSVRESLKADLKAQFLERMESDPEMKNNPFAGLGMLVGPALVDRMVDSTITPATLSKIAQTKEQGAGRAEPGSVVGKAVVESRYTSLDRFRASRTGSDGKTFTFIFTRHGLFTWRVSRIEIPAGILDPKDS